MFKKIVSQLSFSPALVNQLAFYAHRLRKEQATRRLGLIFVALALVVQSLVVFQPPEAANASNNMDFIPGGLGYGSNLSINNFLEPYDRNERNLQDIFNYFGVTREEIAATKLGNFTIGTKKNYGLENRAGSTTIAITDSNYQQVTTIYGRPLTIWGDSPTSQRLAYIGNSEKIGWFAILQSCGNIVTDNYPEKPTPPSPANVITAKTAVNSTQGIDATKNSAKANDVVKYTVSAQNTGGTAKAIEIKDNLSDVLGFSTLTSTGGGSFNANTNILSWPSVDLQPGAKVEKTYTVQLNSSLVTTKTNCSMTNNFIDQVVTVPVDCTTPPAVIEPGKTATNITQGNIDATTVTAKEYDRITYKLSLKNSGGTPKEVTFEDALGDVLEYASIVDNGGGSYNTNTRLLSWPKVTLAPGEQQVRAFTVQIKADIPATPEGLSDPSSYDCKIENAFFTESTTVDITCPAPKIIEQIVPELPKTGARENMVFAGIVLAVVVYFYLRSKQLGTEIRLIRRDVNGGTI